jgi:ribosomal RNA assembly protein
LVGKEGKAKKWLEEACAVTLEIDSDSGEVSVVSGADLEKSDPLKAMQIVNAIAKGFSPERSARLLQEDNVLDVIDLTTYTGKSKNSMERIKGRVIGYRGKARRVIEELTGTYISVYGHTVATIGTPNQIRQMQEALDMLASGSPHKAVYSMLQRKRSQAKLERLKLWEESQTG